MDTDPCLGISLIQQDDPPLVLSVNVIADPCPTAAWTLDGAPLPAAATGVTVSTLHTTLYIHAAFLSLCTVCSYAIIHIIIATGVNDSTRVINIPKFYS